MKVIRTLFLPLMLIVLLTVGLRYIHSGPPAAPDYAAGNAGAEVLISISNGESGSDIAKSLFDAGVVKSIDVFFRIAVADERKQPWEITRTTEIRPLTDAGLLPHDFALSLPSVSGYSGGGRSMIEAYEAGTAPLFEAYALGLSHKHIPEIMHCTGLTCRPLFVPSVGNFKQGMIVQLPLHLSALPGRVKASDLHDALAAHYAQTNDPADPCVAVLPPTDDLKLDATALNDTNRMELRVFANEAHGHAVLMARLDNLGKGASGAAVQNLRLMIGV